MTGIRRKSNTETVHKSHIESTLPEQNNFMPVNLLLIGQGIEFNLTIFLYLVDLKTALDWKKK